MDKTTRHQKLREHQLAQKGWVATLINRGEQVQYFDGVRYIEGEVTWSWTEPAHPGDLPHAKPPIHIYADSLFVSHPPDVRAPLQVEEQVQIAQRIRESFIEQGAEALVEFQTNAND